MFFYLYRMQPGDPAERFLSDLREKGEWPGLAQGEKSSISQTLSFDAMVSRSFPASRTATCAKNGASSKYHYTVVRAAQESEWKLEKAWRSDPDGKVIEEYRLP